jgi:SulP family sulfate permease
MPADFFAQGGALAAALPSLNPVAVALGGACLALVAPWPKSYAMAAARAACVRGCCGALAHVPGTVVALGGATVATVLLDLQVETIRSRFGGIPQALPALALPEFSLDQRQATRPCPC